MNTDNILLLSDSYKLTHYKQYPPQTEKVYSYFESRGGKFNETVFFGLQYFLKKYLSGPVVSMQDIHEAARFYQDHFGSPLFNIDGWAHIVRKHGGRLPVRIKAVPEGTVVPTQNVLMTIENTDPEVPWLTNFLETLLVQVWYPMTVATISREMKKMILGYLEHTGSPEGIDFKLHDFGFRGVSSVESAGLGGMSHLVNFQGTDTVAALMFAREYYGAEMAGFSIPASEHSTITSWGQENEAAAFENMLDQFPEGLVACVSDSYDIYHACRHLWGQKLKDKVLGRDGTLVIRPDSGDPPTVVLEVLRILEEVFGTERNKKGFKVLPPQVRIIQGDGVDLVSTRQILALMQMGGWSADNIAFGMGGALLQKLNRDTQKCAFKCSSVVVDGVDRPVFKKPITDPGKMSKTGYLKLIRRDDGKLETIGGTIQDSLIEYKDELIEVFRDGEVINPTTFDEVRERAKI